MPDQRILSSGDFLLGICANGHRPFHIRLTRAEPDFAHEHVLDLDRVRTFHRNCCGYFARHHRRQFDLPTPGCIGLGGLFIVANTHRDRFVRVRPTPYSNLLLLLQHHVVAKHCRQSHFRKNRVGANKRKNAQQRYSNHRGAESKLHRRCQLIRVVKKIPRADTNIIQTLAVRILRKIVLG